MVFGALIIGDEIIRGKRQDKHLAKVIELLAARGLHLSWSTYVCDDRQRLTAALRQTLAAGEAVFSFGGIGVTPDDHTRQAAAAAAGVALALHPQAEAELRARYGSEISPARLELGVFPLGSRIIPNPYNRVPGFSLGEHHFFPGFPQMAWPMLEWVLEEYYRPLFHAQPEAEHSIIIADGNEGSFLELMRRLQTTYAEITIFSLPSIAGERRELELGVRGEPKAAAAAMAEIRAEASRLSFSWEDAGTK